MVLCPASRSFVYPCPWSWSWVDSLMSLGIHFFLKWSPSPEMDSWTWGWCCCFCRLIHHRKEMFWAKVAGFLKWASQSSDDMRPVREADFLLADLLSLAITVLIWMESLLSLGSQSFFSSSLIILCDSCSVTRSGCCNSRKPLLKQTN